MLYIAIGSNLGNRLHNIQQALTLLKKNNFKILKTSPIIETEAILLPEAPEAWNLPFYNMIVAVSSPDSLTKIHKILQEIERKLGRIFPYNKWAPRVIDLDILLADNQIINEPALTIPHPELLNRPFLIHLLALIAPDFIHPITKKSFAQIAYELKTFEKKSFTKTLIALPQLVGILNLTADSFSSGLKNISPEEAVFNTLKMHEEGASVIDIGAQATNPQATIRSWEHEYQILKPVLELLTPEIHAKKLRISIDTFYPETILKLINDYPISWINDVKGQLPSDCLKKIADTGQSYVITHSISIPPNQNNIIPFEPTPAETLLAWGKSMVNSLKQYGFKEEQIIIDPGIGYGKTPYQNLALLNDLPLLKTLGCPILIGHSQKLFLSLFTQVIPQERDIETLAISNYCADQQIDYLRIHNIPLHQRFLGAKLNAYHGN